MQDLKIKDLKIRPLNHYNQNFLERKEACNWLYICPPVPLPHDKGSFEHLFVVVDDVKLTDTAKVEVKQLKSNVLPTTRRQVISSGHYYHEANSFWKHLKYEQDMMAEFVPYTVDHEVDVRRNLNKMTTFKMRAWVRYGYNWNLWGRWLETSTKW